MARGWGAALGFPVIELTASGDLVDGFLFTSKALDEHWARLDDFEGEGYQRLVTDVLLPDGRTAAAYVYAHRPNDDLG